jgi:peptide/nickel transport system permease protein
MSRLGYLAKRLVLSVPILIFGTTLTFMIIRLGPLSPAAAIAGMKGLGIQQIRRQLGLTQPLWEQYFEYMINLFTFDLGQSWVLFQGTSVYSLILEFAPRTIWLGFWSVLIALLIGIPLGFYAGLNPNTLRDYFASSGGIVWRAMPNFWLGIILIVILSQLDEWVGFAWQPWLVQTTIIGPPNVDFLGSPLGAVTNPFDWWIGASGSNDSSFLAALKKVAPAALVLGSASMGNEMRIGRTAVLETINSDYVETARAKGLSSRTIIWKHVFRNALIPLVPIITGEFLLLLGGSVIIEVIFGINGLGWLFYNAITSADLPMVGSLMFIFILLTVGTNILQDILYALIDPRVGYERN